MELRNFLFESEDNWEVVQVWKLFTRGNIFSTCLDNVVGIRSALNKNKYTFVGADTVSISNLVDSCKHNDYPYVKVSRTIFNLARNTAYGRLYGIGLGNSSSVLEIVRYDSDDQEYICELYVLPEDEYTEELCIDALLGKPNTRASVPAIEHNIDMQ